MRSTPLYSTLLHVKACEFPSRQKCHLPGTDENDEVMESQQVQVGPVSNLGFKIGLG